MRRWYLVGASVFPQCFADRRHCPGTCFSTAGLPEGPEVLLRHFYMASPHRRFVFALVGPVKSCFRIFQCVCHSPSRPPITAVALLRSPPRVSIGSRALEGWTHPTPGNNVGRRFGGFEGYNSRKAFPLLFGMGAEVRRNRGSEASLSAVLGSIHKEPWESNPPIPNPTVLVYLLQLCILQQNPAK